ncbi:MAG: ribonuclease P protein component [Balneolaceae bacterium]|nr:ribonuclease P protein component [Balneolaceae bacterium]
MKKGLNSNSDTPDKDFSLPKAKILRGRKNFQHLFERDAILFRAEHVNLRFRLFSEANNQYQMGFIVKKGLGKATKRNRVKRLLKEAYRLNQHILSDSIKTSSYSFHGALMANAIDVTFEQIQQNIVELLRKVQAHILSTTDSDS